MDYLLRVEAADLTDYRRCHTAAPGILPQINALTTFVVMASPRDTRA